MRPEHFQSILGTTFVKHSANVVLAFSGGKSYDRFQLAALGIPQLKAARYLHLICRRLSITTPAQLAARIGELPTIKGIGHAAFYVALAIVHHEGLEDRAVNIYADVAVSRVPHASTEKDWEPVPVTFATLKHRKPTNKRKPKQRKVA